MSENDFLNNLKKVAKKFSFNLDDAKEMKDVTSIIEEELAQTFHEKVFNIGKIWFNNAPFERVCPRCTGPIGPRSVHQLSKEPNALGELGCVECVIHVCKWYKDTGDCYFPNCLNHYEKVLTEFTSSIANYCVMKGDRERMLKNYKLWGQMLLEGVFD